MLNAISVDLEDYYHICGIDDVSAQSERSGYNVRLEKNVDKILNLLN